jgi:plasmid stability protein
MDGRSAAMASITVRRFDENLKKQLRLRAARNGRSMEDEVRVILREALLKDDDDSVDLGTAIRRRFSRFGDVQLEFPPRGPMRKLPRFDR